MYYLTWCILLSFCLQKGIFSDFDWFWTRLDNCVTSKEKRSYQMSHFAKSVVWNLTARSFVFFQSWPLGRNYLKEFANISFSFLFFNLELKRQKRACTAFFSLENHTQFQTKMSKVYTLVLDRKSAKTISFGLEHAYAAYSVYKGITPGRKSKYLKSSVRGPECPLNASFGRDMHFEKERIDLKGWYWNQTTQR